jgi:hypothetical protein
MSVQTVIDLAARRMGDVDNAGIVVTIDEYWLTFLVSTALPMVVALITNRLASGTVKSLTLLLLAVITGWATSLYATGGVFELKAAAVGIVVSFITAVGSHFGLLAPSGVTGKNGGIAVNLPEGLGREVKDPAIR